MIDLLQRIASQKRAEIDELKAKFTADDLTAGLEAGPRYGFRSAVTRGDGVAIIAELAWQPQGGGKGGTTIDPISLAAQYRMGGAAALSVLTDQQFFGGRPENMEIAKRASQLPILGKDFVIDPYQVRFARFMNADAVLLMVRLLTRRGLADCIVAATELEMDAVVEIQHRAELEMAIEAGAAIISVNLRGLGQGEVSLEQPAELLGIIPKGVVPIAGAGIGSVEQIRVLRQAGYRVFVVGEALLKAPDPAGFIQELHRG